MAQKNLRDLRIALVLMALTLPIVILLFRWVQPKVLAATFAGTWFCASGTFVLYRYSRWTRPFKSPAFWLTLVFTLGVAYPMLLVRVLNWNLPFESLTVLGMAGPEFHKLSNRVFALMFGVTAFDYYRVWLSLRAGVTQNKDAGGGQT